MSHSFQPPLDQFAPDLGQQKKQPLYPFEFFYSSPSQEIVAPHPDSFELDLDLGLAAEEPSNLQLLAVDSNPAFHLVRSDQPVCGPLSNFTVSSESTYDSRSAHSESLYNGSYAQSNYSASNFSHPLDLEMEFQKINVDAMSDYLSDYGNFPQQPAVSFDALGEAAGFGLPPTPPYSPDSPTNIQQRQESFADYDSSYSQVSGNSSTKSATSPDAMSSGLPLSKNSSDGESEDKGDPRKKYKCNVCPRAFARAYNLKTHMATHDPNRLKPHVCPHRSCGRSFSRKHDLGRHMISIHREDRVDVDTPTKKGAIGVDKGRRNWCDQCGKGSVDGQATCDCESESD